MRRILLVSLTVLAVLALVVLVAPYLFPWSPLNCWHEEVDITTGRMRFQWYLMFCKVSERTEETALSEVVVSSTPSTPAPQWHRVNTFSPGVHYSPHYRFHGARYQIRQLAEIWDTPEIYDFPQQLRKATARHVLALWQEGGDYQAGDYIRQLEQFADPAKRPELIASLVELSEATPPAVRAGD